MNRQIFIAPDLIFSNNKKQEHTKLKILYFIIAFAFAVFIFYVITHKDGFKNEQTGKPLSTGINVKKNNTELIFNEKLPKVKDTIPVIEVVTDKVSPDNLVSYAETLIGTPYKYGSANPSEGFDCSGFITYVFNHYKIKVPRSSKDFENAGTEIPIVNSKRGDLILFTGTDSTERVIGHMGIVISNDNIGLKFIHSTSGKAYSVVISDFNKYYQGRFVKTIRIFF